MRKTSRGTWSKESRDDDDEYEDPFFIALDEEVTRDYGLADEFEDDFWDTFADTAHFGVVMTFEMRLEHKPYRFRTKVVWDTETLTTRLVVQQQGVYMGEVLCFIRKHCFFIEPKPEEIIWEIVYREDRSKEPDDETGEYPVKEVKQGWRIINVVDSEFVYELSLDKLTSN